MELIQVFEERFNSPWKYDRQPGTDNNQDRYLASRNGYMVKRDDGCQEEPPSLEIELVVGHEKVPKEEAAVKHVGALEKRHRGRHLATGHRGKPREWTQGSGGSWKKFAAGCRGMTRRAGVIRSKGHSSRTWQEQCCTKNPEMTDVQEEAFGSSRMAQRDRQLRLTGAGMSWKQENNQ
jgi:hypothetical protein